MWNAERLSANTAPRYILSRHPLLEVPPRMTSLDDLKQTIRRNKMLGMWAAEQLGITGRDAETYSDALAAGTLDPEHSDVLSKIRKDFAAAGVVQSDEQILHVMNDFMLQAGDQVAPEGATDAAAVMLARKLTSG
jgi:hypothetical protein